MSPKPLSTAQAAGARAPEAQRRRHRGRGRRSARDHRGRGPPAHRRAGGAGPRRAARAASHQRRPGAIAASSGCVTPEGGKPVRRPPRPAHGRAARRDHATRSEPTGLDRVIDSRAEQQLDAYRDRRARAGTAPLEKRVRALARQRTAEGYMADVHRDDDGDSSSSSITARSAPPRPRARASAVRSSSCSATRSDPTVTIERTAHILAGDVRCAYLIRPVDAARDRSADRTGVSVSRPERSSVPGRGVGERAVLDDDRAVHDHVRRCPRPRRRGAPRPPAGRCA